MYLFRAERMRRREEKKLEKLRRKEAKRAKQERKERRKLNPKKQDHCKVVSIVFFNMPFHFYYFPLPMTC